MGKIRRQRNRPSQNKQKSKLKPTPQDPSAPIHDVASLETLKSESGNQMSKRDKIKLRRLQLLSKMDRDYQSSQNPKEQPLSNATVKKRPVRPPKAKKGTEKASARQKKFLQGVKLFKKLMQNKDPKKIIAKRVASVVKLKKM